MKPGGILLLLLLSSSLFAEEAFEARRPAWAAESRVLSSSHFKIYHEDPFTPAGVLSTLEGLYAKMKLDLGPFAPWTAEQPVTIFLYKSEESYRVGSGEPGWSGGYIIPQTREVHIFYTEAFQRTMAHELGHLFFTSFFIEKKTDPPVWLNEGVARVMEWDYGMEGDDRAVRHSLRRASAMPLNALFGAPYQHNGDGGSNGVSLYYSQSYSLTKFLMHRFSRASFLSFCGALREGKSINDALKDGYGFQVPDTSSLERLWRETLSEN